MKAGTNKPLVAFGVLGIILGGFIGFLSRPASPLAGRVSFMAALTRGASLEGVEQVMIRLAERSFDVMLIGAVIGLVVAVILGYFLKR